MDLVVAQQLLVSLGLGMLIGLQRERVASSVGGIRTFPLITLLGTISGQLAQTHGGCILAAGFVSLTALAFVPNLPRIHNGEGKGMTTEVAVLLLYALGAYIVSGSMVLAVALGGVIALLLHWKEPLHRFVGAVGDEDMHAIMRFVLISMVILPVLPNKAFGSYDVFNPFEVWLMVVLIVGLGLVGYVAYKLMGQNAGVLLSGVLGGAISSTAATINAARQNHGVRETAGLASSVIMIAAVVSVVRVLVEIGLVAPRRFSAMALPLGALLVAMLVIAAAAYLFTTKQEAAIAKQQNPAALKGALIFAAMYAVMKLATAWSREEFGAGGLYVVGVISGLTNMDAITLSTAQLVEAQKLEPEIGWRTILIATLSNIAFKGGAVAIIAGRALFLRVGLLFGLSIAAGGLIFWLWP